MINIRGGHLLNFKIGEVQRIQKMQRIVNPHRSRREFSNEFLLAKFGFDIAENESSKVFQTVARQLDILGHT